MNTNNQENTQMKINTFRGNQRGSVDLSFANKNEIFRLQSEIKQQTEILRNYKHQQEIQKMENVKSLAQIFGNINQEIRFSLSNNKSIADEEDENKEHTFQPKSNIYKRSNVPATQYYEANIQEIIEKKFKDQGQFKLNEYYGNVRPQSALSTNRQIPSSRRSLNYQEYASLKNKLVFTSEKNDQTVINSNENRNLSRQTSVNKIDEMKKQLKLKMDRVKQQQMNYFCKPHLTSQPSSSVLSQVTNANCKSPSQNQQTQNIISLESQQTERKIQQNQINDNLDNDQENKSIIGNQTQQPIQKESNLQKKLNFQLSKNKLLMRDKSLLFR
ncbi:UNKNOWN [Stylonychia lemnae]|uniref:Uncharacterized protein n=1 Tax=Stylonychia lemnae TaxID=5949 RepID=A0A078ALN6_STYLE|nr:UNKNOWN [Stylonychia lemnae]|eukprot:CDW83139.1 UNKNOWN [Stylonychia lemnae]